MSVALGPGWTTERTDLTRKLWADGYSAQQIAKQLGAVTRNAVIGKLHRLGLGDGPRPKLSKANAPRPQRNRTYHKPKFAKVRPMEVLEPVASLNVPLTELRDSQCHAVTDPTRFAQRYCGHPVEGEGASYCAAHARLFRQTTGKAR